VEPTKDQINKFVVRAAAAGPLAGIADATGNSLAVGAAAAAAVVINDVISAAQVRRHQRAEGAVALASRIADIDQADFAKSIVSNDHILELSMMLLEAASRTANEQHFMMLAHLLAEGSFIHDAAETDSFAYIVKTVSNLDGNHLRALKSLGEDRDKRYENLIRPEELTKYISTHSIHDSICNDLIVRNLAKGYSPNDLNAQVKAELSISYNSNGPTAYTLTSLGREVCRRLQEAAANPDYLQET
jgi:hypothetical protein